MRRFGTRRTTRRATRKPRYTRNQIARMVESPDPEFARFKGFGRSMATAVLAAKRRGLVSRGGHDKLLQAIARRRHTFEEKHGISPERSQEFGRAVNRSIAFGKPDQHGQVETDVMTVGKYKGFHDLITQRLWPPGAQNQKNRGEDWFIEHRIGRKVVKTNIIRPSVEGEVQWGVQVLNMHPDDRPAAYEHLKKTWKAAHEMRTVEEKLGKVAEYEWWFYQANPTNRGGASIGDCMSASLRMSLGLPLEPYAHRDWHALTLPLKDYVKMRVGEGLRQMRARH